MFMGLMLFCDPLGKAGVHQYSVCLSLLLLYISIWLLKIDAKFLCLCGLNFCVDCRKVLQIFP